MAVGERVDWSQEREWTVVRTTSCAFGTAEAVPEDTRRRRVWRAATLPRAWARGSRSARAPLDTRTVISADTGPTVTIILGKPPCWRHR